MIVLFNRMKMGPGNIKASFVIKKDEFFIDRPRNKL